MTASGNCQDRARSITTISIHSCIATAFNIHIFMGSASIAQPVPFCSSSQHTPRFFSPAGFQHDTPYTTPLNDVEDLPTFRFHPTRAATRKIRPYRPRKIVLMFFISALACRGWTG